MKELDSHFIPIVTHVFAHPLLKNATIKTNSLDTDNVDSTDDVENIKVPANEIDFLDPLGVASSGIKLDIDMTKVEIKSNKVTKEDSENRLDNTLAGNLTWIGRGLL